MFQLILLNFLTISKSTFPLIFLETFLNSILDFFIFAIILWCVGIWFAEWNVERAAFACARVASFRLSSLQFSAFGEIESGCWPYIKGDVSAHPSVHLPLSRSLSHRTVLLYVCWMLQRQFARQPPSRFPFSSSAAVTKTGDETAR